MMAVSTNIAALDTRMATFQHGLQRLDNGTIDTQGRLAALQDWLQRPPGHLESQANASAVPNGPAQVAGDDSRLSRA